MSSGTRVEMDRAASEEASRGEFAQSAPYPSDEEILGIDAHPDTLGADEQARHGGQAGLVGQGSGAPENASAEAAQGPSSKNAQQSSGERSDENADLSVARNAEELRSFREAFPGGAREARQLREAARAVEQIDAAIYSGDARARSQLVAELARTNPAAFRQLFAEAARLLSEGQGMGPSADDRRGATHDERRDSSVGPVAPDLPQNDNLRRGAARPQNDGSRGNSPNGPGSEDPGYSNEQRGTEESRGDRGQSTNHESQVTTHAFDASAYAAFERGTNDAVARDVRSAISSTLERVLPEGIAEGAARRIGDDIFSEIHRTLAADQALSAQIGEVLRGWQFGAVEQQRVASLLAARAKQALPGVARRVIGEWTSSVLGAVRSKAARQSAAASRIDIGTSASGSSTGASAGRGDSREIDYRSMSDEDILSL